VVTGAGDGLGVMMGDGLGCYDIDHGLDGDTLSLDARAAVEQITERVIWVERSKSGHGLHVFVETYATKGYRRNGVEFYPCSRFIAVTGDHFTI
jgi:primase-polymerase (primpol)-like protein